VVLRKFLSARWNEKWTISLEDNEIFVTTPDGLKLGPPVLGELEELDENPSLLFCSDESDVFFETNTEGITSRLVCGTLIKPSEKIPFIQNNDLRICADQEDPK